MHENLINDVLNFDRNVSLATGDDVQLKADANEPLAAVDEVQATMLQSRIEGLHFIFA